MIINNNTNITYTTLPTKKEILRRLFEQGHIDFDEMWVLLQMEEDTRYVMMPVPSEPVFIPPHVNPFNPDSWTIALCLDDKSDRELHNS